MEEQAETPTFGVRVFDTYGISTTNPTLALRNCGLNKRMHFNDTTKDGGIRWYKNG